MKKSVLFSCYFIASFLTFSIGLFLLNHVLFSLSFCFLVSPWVLEFCLICLIVFVDLFLPFTRRSLRGSWRYCPEDLWRTAGRRWDFALLPRLVASESLYSHQTWLTGSTVWPMSSWTRIWTKRITCTILSTRAEKHRGTSFVLNWWKFSLDK